MKAGDYVKVLDAVKGLESSSYYNFDMLWKNSTTPGGQTAILQMKSLR